MQAVGRDILLVDDEAIQRSIAFDILEGMGYCANVVSSGEAAIEFVKSEKVDFLVLGAFKVALCGLDCLALWESTLFAIIFSSLLALVKY